MYFSIYLCGVNVRFLLSFYANSSSFIFSHLSIFAFIGFHGLNIPLYTFILCTLFSWIPSTQSYVVPANKRTICWLYLSVLTSWVDLGLDLNKFPTKPSKNINPPSELEGNDVRRVHNEVSPEITLWVNAMLKCLQYRNEWGYRSVSYLSLFIKLVIDSRIHSSLASCMHTNTSS